MIDIVLGMISFYTAMVWCVLVIGTVRIAYLVRRIYRGK